MKIALISSGSSIHVKKIANALAERGHDICLYTLPNHNMLLPDFDKRIRVVKLPFKGKLGYILNAPFIRRELKKQPFDIINAHYVTGYGTLARLVNQHPLAVAVFGSDVFEYPFRSKLNMSIVVKNLDCADVITSTSQVMANQVREFFHHDRMIHVTPFGVDLKRFYPVEVEKDGCFEIGIVKKIETIYGLDYLLRAFRLLKEQYAVSNSRLVIYGRGSAEEKYKDMVAEMDLNDSVFFNGFIQNEIIPYKISHMDVACFPSIVDESFGVAVVEAMACGVPVITTDAAGFTEVVEDNVTGFIVPKKDEKALAAALYRVYSMTADERKNMGTEEIRRVHKLYDFEKNMDIYEDVLKEALKGFKS